MEGVELDAFCDTSGSGTSENVYAVITKTSEVCKGLKAAKSRLAVNYLTISRFKNLCRYTCPANLVDNLSQLKKDDVVALAKAIDGFLSSDIGKVTQMVVFAAFPEMKIAKDVAMPIVQQFIKKYQEESGGKNIAQLGEFAAALSCGEVDAESVDNVINLDQLGLIPWDKTQVLTLAKKVRTNGVTSTRLIQMNPIHQTGDF
ncbi:hypothetical protein OS493_015898 [Desmophyllum pertusum]|uniref:Uncharacterized protein n=1 Tax=Desmophyllum pertusum TaxID=174260 RepID=A0A9X0CGJ6_9CNID|nr:hypothetical protein OS493_015898 [Desmophyllum pertusum]